MRTTYFVLFLLVCFTNHALKAQGNEELKEPISKTTSRNITNYDFISKGTWMTGGQFSFATNNYDDYKLLIIEDWQGSSYNFKVTPYVMYAFKDNTGVGLKFSYARSETDLQSLSIGIDDDIAIDIKDSYDVSHMFYTTVFLRNYLGLEQNKRFGLYVDTELSYGYGQGKGTSGSGEDISGTYKTIHELNVGVTPGLTAFINDNFAVELFINLVGLSVKNVQQVTDQVDYGSYTKAKADFKINILSVGFATSIYF